jgi:hypothetical protein
MTGATLYPLEPLFQNKAQASAFLFPQRHGPEIAGVVVGVSRDLFGRDWRHLLQHSRHVYRCQREDEEHRVVGIGAVGEPQMATCVAVLADQFESLGHGQTCLVGVGFG